HAGVAARMDEARRVIAAHFPQGTRVSDPPGGLLLWLELPRALDSVQLHEACLAQQILIAPGTVFSASGRFRNCLRIGVGGDWSPAHLEALRTVGDMATRMLQGQRQAA
ncbi:MAG: PLP-dependent aminotransferase family protein, partial [Acidovorax sp.]|nr:PLP-dependent aminotransferase family protein [Acidovorax sp.]